MQNRIHMYATSNAEFYLCNTLYTLYPRHHSMSVLQCPAYARLLYNNNNNCNAFTLKLLKLTKQIGDTVVHHFHEGLKHL